MKKLLAVLAVSLMALTGCKKEPERIVVVQQVVQQDYSREAYCRSIGLYKEWDSNDCETFADAYDLDEGSSEYKKKKKWYSTKYPKYKKYDKVVYVKGTPILSNKALLEKNKKQKAELKKQQAANAKKNAELKKLKAEKAAADAKIKRQAAELKKQQAANKAEKDKEKAKNTPPPPKPKKKARKSKSKSK